MPFLLYLIKMSVMLASLTGFYAWGTTIGDILQDWEYFGVFEYVLPGLLIFAIVFGILMKSKILGESRGINMVIALATGLLAMRSLTLREFFGTIFPFAGIGIAILLVALILTGLFHSDKPWWNSVFFGIGMAVAVIVVLVSLSSYDWMGGWWWQQNWEAIITLLVLTGLVVLVVFGQKKKEEK